MLKATIQRAATAVNDNVTRRVLLNPKVWIGVFDLLTVLLLKQLNLDIEPDILIISQGIVLVIIATISDSEVS